MRALIVNNYIRLKKRVLVQLTLPFFFTYMILYDTSTIFLDFVFHTFAFCCNVISYCYSHIVLLCNKVYK